MRTVHSDGNERMTWESDACSRYVCPDIYLSQTPNNVEVNFCLKSHPERHTVVCVVETVVVGPAILGGVWIDTCTLGKISNSRVSTRKIRLCGCRLE